MLTRKEDRTTERLKRQRGPESFKNPDSRPSAVHYPVIDSACSCMQRMFVEDTVAARGGPFSFRSLSSTSPSELELGRRPIQ